MATLRIGLRADGHLSRVRVVHCGSAIPTLRGERMFVPCVYWSQDLNRMRRVVLRSAWMNWKVMRTAESALNMVTQSGQVNVPKPAEERSPSGRHVGAPPLTNVRRMNSSKPTAGTVLS